MHEITGRFPENQRPPFPTCALHKADGFEGLSQDLGRQQALYRRRLDAFIRSNVSRPRRDAESSSSSSSSSSGAAPAPAPRRRPAPVVIEDAPAPAPKKIKTSN
jgi:hypothetical protein